MVPSGLNQAVEEFVGEPEVKVNELVRFESINESNQHQNPLDFLDQLGTHQPNLQVEVPVEESKDADYIDFLDQIITSQHHHEAPKVVLQTSLEPVVQELMLTADQSKNSQVIELQSSTQFQEAPSTAPAPPAPKKTAQQEEFSTENKEDLQIEQRPDIDPIEVTHTTQVKPKDAKRPPKVPTLVLSKN